MLPEGNGVELKQHMSLGPIFKLVILFLSLQTNHSNCITFKALTELFFNINEQHMLK